MSDKAEDVTEDLEEALYAGVESKKVDVVRVLMKQGVNNHTRTTFGESALQAAARQEDTTILLCLLERDVRINVEDFCEVCYVALDECRSEALRILLSKATGFDAHWYFKLLDWMAIRDDDELTPLLWQQILNKSFMVEDCKVGQSLTNAGLHLAVQNSDRDLASLMLGWGADINGLDQTERTPLLVSLESNPSMALFLLERGASVLIADPKGRTPGHMCAVIQNDQDVATDTLQALLSKGADPNLSCSFEGSINLTPLEIAAGVGNYESVELLLDHAARKNITCDRFGNSLHFAALDSHTAILRLLLERGADPDRTFSIQIPKAPFLADNLQHWQGCTPLHMAAWDGDDDSVEQLLQSFAHVSARNHDDTTPLHVAAYTGSFSVTGLLVSYGADTEAKSKSFREIDDANDLTPLHIAVRCRHISIVRRIIEARGNVNAKDSKGQTPLHHALRCDDPTHGIIILLLKAGAAIDCQDELGETPAQIVLDPDLSSVKTLFDAYALLAAGENNEDRSIELDSGAETRTLIDTAVDMTEWRWRRVEAESPVTSEADPAPANEKTDDDDVFEYMFKSKSSDIQSTTFTDPGEDTWSILPSRVPNPFREVSVRYIP